MSRHQEVYPFIHSFFEWKEFQFFKLSKRFIHQWQTRMGIDRCISVTWEMLGCYSHIVVLNAFHHRNTKIGNPIWVR